MFSELCLALEIIENLAKLSLNIDTYYSAYPINAKE